GTGRWEGGGRGVRAWGVSREGTIGQGARGHQFRPMSPRIYLRLGAVAAKRWMCPRLTLNPESRRSDFSSRDQCARQVPARSATDCMMDDERNLDPEGWVD